MKKAVYNVLLVVLYFICASWATLIMFAMMMRGVSADWSVLQLYFGVLIHILLMLGLHYGAMLWGKKRGLLHKVSIVLLCFVDLLCFHLGILVALLNIGGGVRSVIGLFTNQGHFVENGCDLILRFIFLIILASRIFFTVRLLKRKKTVR